MSDEVFELGEDEEFESEVANVVEVFPEDREYAVIGGVVWRKANLHPNRRDDDVSESEDFENADTDYDALPEFNEVTLHIALALFFLGLFLLSAVFVIATLAK